MDNRIIGAGCAPAPGIVRGMKAVFAALALAGAAAPPLPAAGAGHTQLLLEPLDIMRASGCEWRVIHMAGAASIRKGTSDFGEIQINADIAKLFKEGFLIYSITVLSSTSQGGQADGLLIVMVRPKPSK